MSEMSLEDLPAMRRTVYEAIFRADLPPAVEVFKTVFTITDDDLSSKMLTVLFSDLVKYLNDLDIASYVQFSHTNSIAFFEIAPESSSSREEWDKAAEFVSNLTDVDRLELMKALLGSAVKGVDIRSQAVSGFGGDIWLDKYLGALREGDPLAALRLFIGTDSDPLKKVMQIVENVDVVISKLSKDPEGLNTLARDEIGKELVEIAIRFQGWSRMLAYRQLILDRHLDLTELITLMSAVSTLVLIGTESK